MVVMAEGILIVESNVYGLVDYPEEMAIELDDALQLYAFKDKKVRITIEEVE